MSSSTGRQPSAAQLRAEIAATRAAIGTDLTEIERRLSREHLAQAARERVEPVAVPAVALAFMLGLALGYAAAGHRKRSRRRPWSYAI